MVSKLKFKQSMGKGTGKSKAGGKDAGKAGITAGKKKEEKQPWLDDLGHSLARKGLRIKGVATDGNCFFRACCDQMRGNEGEHMVLRRKVVDFMQEHADDFAPYMEDDEDFGSYCERMAKEGCWAGQQEQVAVTRVCGVEICIHQAGQPCWMIHPDFPEIPRDAPTWHLSYHDGEHYNSVRLANGFDTSSPVPIIVVDGKPASAAKLPGKSEGTWEDWQIKQVSQGTGNFDSAAVNQALTEACGSVDQAIELLVDRMAAEPELQEAPVDGATVVEAGSSAASQVDLPEQSLEPVHEQSTSSTAPGVGQSGTTSTLKNADEQRDVGVDNQASCIDKDRSAEQQDRMRCESEDAEGTDVKEKRRAKGFLKERGPPRNRQCACGSGRKFKNCCGAVRAAAARREKAAAEKYLSVQPDQTIQMESLYV